MIVLTSHEYDTVFPGLARFQASQASATVSTQLKVITIGGITHGLSALIIIFHVGLLSVSNNVPLNPSYNIVISDSVTKKCAETEFGLYTLIECISLFQQLTGDGGSTISTGVTQSEYQYRFHKE